MCRHSDDHEASVSVTSTAGSPASSMTRWSSHRRKWLELPWLNMATGQSVRLITEGATAGGFTEGDFRKALEAQTPLGRIGQPDDIAPAAVFFASDDSKWVTGETLLIAGGLR